MDRDTDKQTQDRHKDTDTNIVKTTRQIIPVPLPKYRMMEGEFGNKEVPFYIKRKFPHQNETPTVIYAIFANPSLRQPSCIRKRCSDVDGLEFPEQKNHS